MIIRPGRADDWPAVRELLEAARLPTDDLDASILDDFLVVVEGSAEAPVIGSVGLQCSAGVGLLRSLVVNPAKRTRGLGSCLVQAVEERARDLGLDELWLLTIDADGFFRRLGFAVESRNEAPAAIRACAEFSSLCPGSAILMRKRLWPRSTAGRHEVESG